MKAKKPKFRKLTGKQFDELLRKNGITNIYNSSPTLRGLSDDPPK